MLPSDIIQFANTLADAARQETLSRFGSALPVDDKGGAGFDPVTEADREAERVMRDLIERHFPEHGISGEEFGDKPPQGPYCWSLDPVDGTRSFICGLPTWVTLIALLEDGQPILGLIDAPCLDERYLGFGQEDLKDSQERLTTSRCRRLAEARLSTTDPYLFEDAEAAQFQRIRQAAKVTRYGHDGYAYARLAAGTLDLVVESGLKPHDYNALIPVVRAAGGVIANWDGGDDFSKGKIIAAATPELFDEAVGLMRTA